MPQYYFLAPSRTERYSAVPAHGIHPRALCAPSVLFHRSYPPLRTAHGTRESRRRVDAPFATAPQSTRYPLSHSIAMPSAQDPIAPALSSANPLYQHTHQRLRGAHPLSSSHQTTTLLRLLQILRRKAQHTISLHFTHLVQRRIISQCRRRHFALQHYDAHGYSP